MVKVSRESQSTPAEETKVSLKGTGKKKPKKEATPEDVDGFLGAEENWDRLEIPALDKKVTTYRASLVGGCVTSLVALQLRDALGLDVSESLPANIMPAAEAGTRMEPVIISKFLDEFGYRHATYPELAKLKDEAVIAGYNPVMHQIQVWRFVGKKKRILLRSHPDAFVTHKRADGGEATGFFDLEVKYLGPDAYKSWVKGGFEAMGDLGAKYAWQVAARMHSHGCPLIFVGAQKLGGNDEETTEIGELHPIVFQPGEEPVDWETIEAKLKTAQEFVKEGILPDNCGLGKFACPAWKLPQCGSGTERTPQTVDDTELGHLLALQVAYGTDKREAEKLLEPVKAQIKKIVEARYPSAEKMSYTVKDEAGNTFKFEWQVIDQPEKTVAGYTSRWSKATLIGKADTE